MDVRDRVEWIYSSENNEEIDERYRQWAEDYEHDMVDGLGWIGPGRAAEVFARLVPREARVLDAGAGTGLVGEALAKMGYRDITGIDMSEVMLARAREKKVYHALRRMVLGERLDFADDHFQAVICVGVFTLGHAPAGSLDELTRVTRPGGLIVGTVQTQAYETVGFKEKFRELEEKGRLELVEVSERYQSLLKVEGDAYHRIWVYRVV